MAAFDSQDKRMAVIGMGTESLPIPDAVIDFGDRKMILGMLRDNPDPVPEASSGQHFGFRFYFGF